MKDTAKTVQRFRYVAIAEGISFLLLLLIAMPLKYFASFPLPVKIVGYLHGFLFIAFIILALETKFARAKSFLWLGLAFLASIIPFGTFWLDKELKKEEAIIRGR